MSLRNVGVAVSILLFGICGNAFGCQYCVIANTYNGFRFTVFWFALLLLWLLANAVIWYFRRNELAGHVLFRLCRPGLGILLWSFVLAVGGGFFLPVLYFPVVLTRRVLGKTTKKEKTQLRDVIRAPVWRRVNGAFLAVSLIVVPVSYRILPTFAGGEAQVRSRIARVKQDHRRLAEFLWDQYHLAGRPPDPQPTVQESVLLYPLPQTVLSEAPPLRGDPFTPPMESPFAYRVLWVQWRLFGWGYPPKCFVNPSADESAPYIQYYPSEQAFILWSAGPRGELPDRVVAWFHRSPAGNSPPLSLHAYDASNGTLSEGILYRWTELGRDRPRSF